MSIRSADCPELFHRELLTELVRCRYSKARICHHGTDWLVKLATMPGHQLGTELVGGWFLFLIRLLSLSRPQAHPGAWSRGAAGAHLPCTSCPVESGSRETVSICEHCEPGRAGCSRTDVTAVQTSTETVGPSRAGCGKGSDLPVLDNGAGVGSRHSWQSCRCLRIQRNSNTTRRLYINMNCTSLFLMHLVS